MYTLTISVRGLPAARQFIQKVVDKVEEKDASAFAALNAIGGEFEKNFKSEGGEVGGWAQLAERTVSDRESKGVTGEHPILVRYGDLRRVTVESLISARRSGTFTATDPDGKTINVSLKSRDGSMNVVASGHKAINQTGFAATNLPERPFWYVNRDVGNAARSGVIDHLVKEFRSL